MIVNYLTKKTEEQTTKWVVLLIELGITIISFFTAYLIRFNLTLNFDTDQLLKQMPVVLLFTLVSMLLLGSFKGVIRHTGPRDVYNIFNVVCASSILTILFVLFNRKFEFLDGFTVPLSIIIIHSLLLFVSLTSARFLFKYLHQRLTNAGLKISKNILIYGAKEAGIITHNVITNSSRNTSRIVGYIGHQDKNVGKQINGVRVYSKSVLNENFIREKSISEIIFSIQDIPSKELRLLVEELVQLPVAIKIVPPAEDWINGELKPSQIKQVQIEDLLDRPPINIKNNAVKEQVKGKSILVSGGAGSIGSELVRQLSNYEYGSLVIIDQAESALYDLQQELKQNGRHNFIPIVCDIRDKQRMNEIFVEYKPNIVFHAAAYKHVPLMEYNSYEAIKINVGGTKILADLSSQYKIEKFVFVSTDKAVNPTNVMGATKRIAEMYISCKQQSSDTKFITTRFGNVLGSNGSVIPLFRKQIEKGGPLTVTHKDITRYFMTIPEASQLVLEAGAMGKGGEIFIFDMGESVKIFDLAKNMIRLSGLSYPEDIDIKITGLRPGEKLYEELLANGENTIPTYNKKIMISKVRDIDFNGVSSKIDELCVINTFLNKNTIKLMKEIVPEYISKNSKFEELDKTKVRNQEDLLISKN